jgi:hypothetical protein
MPPLFNELRRETDCERIGRLLGVNQREAA